MTAVMTHEEHACAPAATERHRANNGCAEGIDDAMVLMWVRVPSWIRNQAREMVPGLVRMST